ncbi:MAG TPA: sulfur globule protein precursor [Xanthobacteraceae bacterium]|jgi:hypothetical protein|nr:sulfur globule protein precursor [Xanthobacteraceae bacterium]
MFRKLVIALAASAALAAAFASGEASARPVGFLGPPVHAGHHHHHGGFFFGGPLFAGYPYAYDYYGGCYQVRRVPTPVGLRWRRVWVCG